MSTFALNTKSDRTYLDKLNIKLEAWSKGQNPWVTIENTGGDIGKKPYIKVKANLIWGDPRRAWSDPKKKDEQ